MNCYSSKRAIGRSLAAVIIVIIVVAVIVGGYLALSQTSNPSTSSSTLSTVSTTQFSSSSAPSSSSTSSIFSTSSSSSSSMSSTTSSSNSATAPNTLVIDDSTWPSGDLNQLYSVSELPWPNWLAMTVYQPLVTVNASQQYGSDSIQFLPGLANWTISADSMTYTFNLRQGVKFSNGDPLNSYQVWFEEYSFYYLSGNSSTWFESYNLYNTAQSDFGPATISLINQTGGLVNPTGKGLSTMMNSSWPIYVTSPSQVVFHLRAPFLYLLSTLVGFDGLIYDSQFVLEHGGLGTPAQFNPYFNQNPIPGTGPYVVTGVAENNYVKFARNPNYWGANLTAAQTSADPVLDPGHVNNVIVYYKPDDLARYTDLSTGAAQISSIQFSDWNLVVTNPQYAYLQMPAWNGLTQPLGLNTHLYPTNITDVRLAIVHAINYTDLSIKAYGGKLHSWVGPEYGMWSQYYDLGQFQPYSYNLTLAQQLLAKANVSNMPTFLLRVASSCDICTNTAQVIQADLSQIGINVNIVVETFAQFDGPLGNFATNVQNAAQIGQLSFPSAGIEWAPATLSPADNWVTFTSNTSLWGNVATYSNPIVQQCDNAFTSSANITYIQSLCQKAQAQIQQDAPYVWIGTSGLYSPQGGSVVWKKGVVSGMLSDPLWTGDSDTALFNTVTFG